MSKDDQVFADGIAGIAITGTIVRIDFISLLPQERDPNGNAKTEVTHRLIMPLDGFLGAYSKLQETVQAMARRGLIKQEPGVPPTATMAGGDRIGTSSVQGASAIPNRPQMQEHTRAEPSTSTALKPATPPFP